MINRRELLAGTSAAALCATMPPALAWIHGSALSGFNGGRSQVQSGNLNFGGDFPFINVLKTAPAWGYADNSGSPLPSELDSNGYPLTSISHGGVKTQILQVTSQSERPGNWVITWDGTGTISVSPFNSGGSITTVSGSLSSSGGIGAGRYVFSTTATDFVFGITAVGSPNITNVQFFHANDETALLAGQIFGPQFLATMRQGNFGVIRFLDWSLANGSNLTTWATRKPIGYVFYGGYELRNSLYAGTTTSAGFNFAATFGSGGPVDKQTIHVNFNDNAVSVSAASPGVVSWTAHGLNVGQAIMFRLPHSGGSLPSPLDQNTTYYVASTTTNSFTISSTNGGTNINTTGSASVSATAFVTQVPQTVITLSNTNPAVVTWANHGLSVGDPVGINSTQNFGLPSPMVNDKVWYVIAAGFTSGAFQFSTTPGGSAVNTSGGTQSGSILAIAVATFNLNSAGKKPILDVWGNVLNPFLNQGPYCGDSNIGTLVYDADIGGWMKFGSNADPNDRQNVGLVSGAPYEVMISLCATLRAHPHIPMPMLALDPMTDFVPSLATYIQTNGPFWMKPRIEGPNETWNNAAGFNATRYGWNKAYYHWGVYQDQNNWYGKVISTIGQAVSAIYANDRTKYDVLCGVQTADNGSSSDNPRLTSALYVSQAVAPQSGYTKSAASGWTTTVCMANYWNPTERDTPAEVVHAFQCAVQNAGNLSAQITIAAAYLNTATSGSNQFNLAGNKALATSWKAWGAAQSVNKLCGYEGGYSPDYPFYQTDSFIASPISAATNANPCVITTPNVTFPTGTSPQNITSATGAASAVGMPLVISGAIGMTQLNNKASGGIVVTGGTPGNIQFNSHGLVVGDTFFIEMNAPTNAIPGAVVPGQVYYVKTVVDANNFTLSATNGAPAINITAGTYTGITCFPCHIVTAVNNDGGGNPTLISLSIDSSSYGTYTASSATAVYGNNAANRYALRTIAKQSATLQTLTAQLYSDFVSVGGEFPSCYYFAGTGTVWAMLDPDIYTTTTLPQFDAIVAFNH